MKIYSKKELKEEFIHQLTGSYNIENQKYKESKKCIDSLFNDFVNLSKSSIGILNEQQTYIIRKRYGVLDNGKVSTLNIMAEEFNVPIKKIEQLVSRARIKLISSACIQSKTNILQYYCESHLISKLLDCRIDYIFSDNIVQKLHQEYNDRMNLRELTNKTSWQVKNIMALKNNEYEEIEQTLNYLNLAFKDKISIIRKKITRKDVILDLVYKFEIDKSYYDIIEDIVNELYNLSLRQVFGFDENKTNILRKVYGILDNGNKPTFKDVASYIGVKNDEEVSQIIGNIFSELNNLVKCFILADVINLDKETLLNTDIKYFNLDTDTYINLRKSGIKTLDKLLELGHNSIECKYSYNKQLIENLTYRFDYLNELNDNKKTSNKKI